MFQMLGDLSYFHDSLIICRSRMINLVFPPVLRYKANHAEYEINEKLAVALQWCWHGLWLVELVSMRSDVNLRVTAGSIATTHQKLQVLQLESSTIRNMQSSEVR